MTDRHAPEVASPPRPLNPDRCPMLCLDCTTRATGDRPPAEAPSRLREDARRLRRLLCVRCGGVLPLTDAADGLLSKLAQLDSFGLGAFARPLLQPRHSVTCGGQS